MENLNQEIQTTHFRYLQGNAIQNPLLFIQQFCFTETAIELFRQDITTLVAAAGTRKTDNNGKFHLNSDEYVYNHRKIIEAIEALWVLHHQASPEFAIDENHPLYQTTKWKRDGIDLETRINSAARYYRKLENEEINDIRLFLRVFFVYADMSEWREILDDILSYAYIDESIAYGSTQFSRELIPLTEYLEKMAEAIFLIAELTHSKKETTETVSNTDIEHTPIVNEQAPDMETGPNTAVPLLSLEDDNFTKDLIEYLNTYWVHLEEQENTFLYSPIMLTERLEKKLLTYFETFHPKFLARNYRRVYMGYLEYIFQTGMPSYEGEIRTFIYQMDTFFELLDLADDETKHWPQEDRIGWQEV
ncbi:hypothetical protein H8S90_12720 [Olivibacter sp. SDN3]|uniref:hypothetical protein n=1 Tax=Olivibacter sp. SDN3 TaxID=2764720 RepID=UPI0016518805|nr:hypothetical protein [Olivibacter sp. SDN3]QNL47694.1 hypothetical protein H8S90_12720 [Olivibacter sp. SDN3]